MKTHVSVEEWVAMFRDIGLDDGQMKKWHHLFEARYPDGHQSFLEWLELPEKDILRIRAESR